MHLSSCQEVGWGNMDWIDLAQDRDMCLALLNAVIMLSVPQNARNFLGPFSYSGKIRLQGGSI